MQSEKLLEVKMPNKDIRTEKGYGFISDDGKQYLVRCHECGRENYAPLVASGCCAWCGYDSNAKAEGK